MAPRRKQKFHDNNVVVPSLPFLNDLASSILIFLVKSIQNIDKEIWSDYLRSRNEGTRDPARHEPQFLRDYLQKAAGEDGRVKDVLTNLKQSFSLWKSDKLDWNELVSLSRGHPLFHHYLNLEGVDLSRLKRKTGLAVISLDCEMVKTIHSDRSIIRVSAVDALTSEVILDSWIKPTAHVLDWKSRTTGIDANKFQKVESLPWHQAQAELLQYIDADTILIGHSLWHDLRELYLKSTRIIDTSLIYRDATTPKRTLGLAHLMKEILSKDVQQGSHSSLNDAKYCLELIELARANGIHEKYHWALGQGDASLTKQ